MLKSQKTKSQKGPPGEVLEAWVRNLAGDMAEKADQDQDQVDLAEWVQWVEWVQWEVLEAWVEREV